MRTFRPFSNKLALRYGLVAGLLLGLLQTGLFHLSFSLAVSSWLLIALLLYLIVPILLGALAVIHARDRYAGTDTGCVIGLVSTLVLLVVTWGMLSLAANSQQSPRSHGLVVFAVVLFLTVFGFVSMILATLGGLIGEVVAFWYLRFVRRTRGRASARSNRGGPARGRQ